MAALDAVVSVVAGLLQRGRLARAAVSSLDGRDRFEVGALAVGFVVRSRSGAGMPEGGVDRFRFDPHATGEEELARRRAVAYHISGFAHWEGIKVSGAPLCQRAACLAWLAGCAHITLSPAARTAGHLSGVHADRRCDRLRQSQHHWIPERTASSAEGRNLTVSKELRPNCFT